MAEFLRTVLIMSASGSVLALLLFMLKPLVRKRIPKSTQYYLWLVVVCALLIPVSRFTTLPAPPTTAQPPVPTLTEAVNRFVITQAEQTQRSVMPIPTAPEHAPSLAFQQELNLLALIITYLVWIYPAGVLVLLLYYSVHYAIFVGLFRCRNVPAPPAAMALLQQNGSGRTPRLFYNKLATTPMLFGIFRPAIILPHQDYTRDEMQAILSHELTHLRRMDVLVKLITLVATAIHRFNPIIWLVSREIDRACELSCDEAVIRDMDSQGRKNYGNTLILVAANPKHPRVIATLSMSENKKNLKERLGAIMRNKGFNPLIIIVSAAILIAAIGLVIVLSMNRDDVVDVADDDYTPPTEYEEFALNIEPATPALLATFDSYHQVDYREIHEAHWNDSADWLQINSPVAIWSSTPLNSFQIIGIELDFVDDGVLGSPSHVYYQVDFLDEPLVISWFFTAGLFPNNGISFMDNDTRRYFAINAAYGSEGAVPYELIEFLPGGYIFSWDTPPATASELCDFCMDHYVGDDLRSDTWPLRVRDVQYNGMVEFYEEPVDEFLQSRFTIVHEDAYVRHGDGLGQNTRVSDAEHPSVVIWPDEALYNFQFVSLEVPEVIDFRVQEVLLTIDELQPSHALVLRLHLFHYLSPRVGFQFTDSQGNEHRMFLAESMRGGCWPYWGVWPFLPDENIDDSYTEDEPFASIDIMYLLGQGGEHVPLERNMHLLGTFLGRYDMGGDYAYYFENGLTATDVMFMVYYGEAEDRRAINFGGIDGTSSIDDVLFRFGAPDDRHEEYFVAYELFDASRRVSFSFDAGGIVELIQFYRIGENYFNIANLVGRSIDNVPTHYFGNIVYTNPDAMDYERLFDSGLRIATSGDVIVSAMVVFDQHYSDYHFNFITSSSTYESVTESFGEPYDIRRYGPDEDRVGAVVSYGYWWLPEVTFVRFFFDANDALVAINYFWP